MNVQKENNPLYQKKMRHSAGPPMLRLAKGREEREKSGGGQKGLTISGGEGLREGTPIMLHTLKAGWGGLFQGQA